VRSSAFPLFLGSLVVIHFLLHVGFGMGESAPDFVAVAVLLAARRISAPGAAALGLGLGILDDAMGIGPLGARSIALGVAGLLGTWSKSFIEGEGPIFIVAYLFVGTWASDIVLSVVSPGDSLSGILALVSWAPLYAAYTALAGVLAFAVFRRVAGPDA
jgi:hypothetical protein